MSLPRYHQLCSPAAYGDLVAAILAVAATIALSRRGSFAISLVWLFNRTSSVAAAPNLSTWTSRSNLAAPSISAVSSGGRCSRKSAFPRDRAPADRLNFRPLPSKANGRSFCPMSNRLRRRLSRQRTRQHANKPSDIQSRFRGSNGNCTAALYARDFGGLAAG